jgi:hypothetical protein
VFVDNNLVQTATGVADQAWRTHDLDISGFSNALAVTVCP